MRLAALLTLLLTTGLIAQDRRIQPIVPRKQVALVIGNAAYANRPLANPVHDAEAVARRLRELNFDVTLATNTGRKAMGQAIDQFVDKLGTGDVAFFYYSGHGGLHYTKGHYLALTHGRLYRNDLLTAMARGNVNADFGDTCIYAAAGDRR